MAAAHSSHLILLLLVALLACPVQAQPICEMTVHAEADACRTQDGLPSTGAGGESDDAPSDGDCCGNGCLDCGLPCCTGVATILPAAPRMGDAVCMRAQPLALASDLVLADLDPVFHPPQS